MPDDLSQFVNPTMDKGIDRMLDFQKVLESYEKKHKIILKRLSEYRKVWELPEERIFAELAFCLCTPQSKAVVCDAAIKKLLENNLLFTGTAQQILPHLKEVRFNENKSRYIVEARKLFTENGKISIKKHIDPKNILKTREWIVENVKGIGWKEVNHFLRNIGFGDNIAILDRHILKNLVKCGVIEAEPKSLTPKLYLEIEGKMKEFSELSGIPMSHLDLLFWGEETGYLFK